MSRQKLSLSHIGIFLLGCLAIFWNLSSYADAPLPAKEAFKFSTKVTGPNQVTLQWQMPPGYYLYKQRFDFKILAPSQSDLKSISYPDGTPKQDDIFGHYEVYFSNVAIPVTLQENSTSPTEPNNLAAVSLRVQYQGCSESGFCYPPVVKTVHLNFASSAQKTSSVTNSPPLISTSGPFSQAKFSQLFVNHNIIWTLFAFFGFGFLLAFTPCVLPMLPILSGIIVGQGQKIKTLQAFSLSLAYVLGMAITFAVAGILAAYLGESIQAAFQKPWVIGLFSLFFLMLAGSLFGFYEIQLPGFMRERIVHISNNQSSGSLIGTSMMGALSTLIVSPCVSAPLIGALAYIGKTGNTVLGGSALLALGLGMGTPLLMLGTLGGKILPKAGPWMNTIKACFGVLMIAVAIWLLERIMPEPLSLYLWGSLLIISSVYLGGFRVALTGWAQFFQGVGLCFAVYGALLFVGAAMGNTDPLKPLTLHRQLASFPAQTPSLHHLFAPVKNISELQHQLNNALLSGKPTMLDFYASWCIECKLIERDVFGQSEVRNALKKYKLLQADITANNAEDQALMKKYGVIAPPVILFFGPNGQEIQSARIVGATDKLQFLQHLKKISIATGVVQ